MDQRSGGRDHSTCKGPGAGLIPVCWGGWRGGPCGWSRVKRGGQGGVRVGHAGLVGLAGWGVGLYSKGTREPWEGSKQGRASPTCPSVSAACHLPRVRPALGWGAGGCTVSPVPSLRPPGRRPLCPHLRLRGAGQSAANHGMFPGAPGPGMSAAGRERAGAPERRVGETQEAGPGWGADPGIAGRRWRTTVHDWIPRCPSLYRWGN